MSHRSFSQDPFSVSPPAVERWFSLKLTDSMQETENLLDYSTSKTDLLFFSLWQGFFFLFFFIFISYYSLALGYTYVVCLIDTKNVICQVDTKIDSNGPFLWD